MAVPPPPLGPEACNAFRHFMLHRKLYQNKLGVFLVLKNMPFVFPFVLNGKVLKSGLNFRIKQTVKGEWKARTQFLESPFYEST